MSMATITALERRVRELEENSDDLSGESGARLRLVAITLAEVAQAMREAHGADDLGLQGNGKVGAQPDPLARYDDSWGSG